MKSSKLMVNSLPRNGILNCSSYSLSSSLRKGSRYQVGMEGQGSLDDNYNALKEGEGEGHKHQND